QGRRPDGGPRGQLGRGEEGAEGREGRVTPAAETTDVEVAGRRLKLSNLDKVLYPEAGFTKGQVIDYYTRIAPALLPHLRGRALTLKRYPNGVDAAFFFEKQCPSHRPPWVDVLSVYSDRKRGAID